MLKIDNISKIFTQKHRTVKAIDNVSFKIKKGDFYSITGPSGSGKSTLLLILGGMSTPTNGKIYYSNESVYDWTINNRADWRAKSLGFIFQTFNLIPYLNVFENVSISLDISKNVNINESHILNILDRMNLSDRLNHYPNELSVGQQQRVAIARALIKDPEIILADEPTGNLDSNTAGEIIDILKEINKTGKTIILITHDNELAKISNHNIEIIDGKINL